MATYASGEYDSENLRVGDVVEDILLPCDLTLRGATRPFSQWYFRLWSAEVKRIKGRVVYFSPSTITVLDPDDPRVLNYLKKKFQPTERDKQEYSD